MVRVFSLGGQNEGDDVAARSSVSPVDRCADPAVVELGSWPCKFASSPQACTPLAVGAGMMPRGLPTRRGLQALALVIATAYATILLYQAVVPRQWVDEMNVAEVNSRSVIVEVPALRKLISEELPVTPSVATATMAPFATNLDDVFISVKTTKHYHHSRLPAIVDTWFQFAKNQTWFFTDRDDPYFQNQTNGHMINTKCSSSHNRRALCCKMSVEFDRFLDSGRKWFCHFDDDNYVNVPRLLKLLDNYNPREDWYLGKPSIPAPLEIIRQGPEPQKRPQKVKFWFATGGAGFCISRALALKMTPVAGGGKFITVGDRIRLPDDVTMGYIIEYLLKKQLTVVEQFHSHLEPMKFLNKDTFHEQVSFSYSKGPRDEWNILKIDGFNMKDDPKSNENTSLLAYGRYGWQCLPQTRAFAGEGENRIVVCDGRLTDRLTGVTWRDNIDHTLRFTSVDEKLADGSYRFVCPPSVDRLGNSRVPCSLDRLYLMENYCSIFLTPYASSVIKPDFERGECDCGDSGTTRHPTNGICVPFGVEFDARNVEAVMSVDRCVETWTKLSTIIKSPRLDTNDFPCDLDDTMGDATYLSCVRTRSLAFHVVSPSPYVIKNKER